MTNTPPPIIIPHKVLKHVGQAIEKFNLIEKGDKILLGLSGGKDSTLLAHIFLHLQKHSPIKFTFQAITILYGMGEDFSEQKKHFDLYGIPHEFLETETYQLSKTKMDPESSFCSFFSRMRRGHLSSAAKQYGCNKVALGHHLDDSVESVFMSMMNNGLMRGMPPKYTAGTGEEVIRPLCFVREPVIRKVAQFNNIPAAGDEMCPGMIMPGAKMPYMRAYTKKMLQKVEADIPNAFDSMRKSLQNVDIKSFYVS